jgi:RNA polymerase sigma-70 factor (sigma-E family)
MPRSDAERDAAFTEFVRSRQVALIRFAWLVSGGSHAHAEDLVQEALTRLYSRWLDVDDPEAYVRTAISRLNISVWRKLRREALGDQPDDRAAPDQRLQPASDAALVRAVRELPAKQRAAVVLRYWCDYSDDQIAQILGCANATVRSSVSRGLARLREAWPQNTTQSMTGSHS